jgi:hypothetical protein
MHYTRSSMSILSERNFCHGSAKSNISAQEGKSMPEVSFYLIPTITAFHTFMFCIVLNPIVNTSSQAPALKHSTTLSKQNKHADYVSPFIGHSTRDNTVSVPTSPIDSDDDHNVPNSFRVGVIIHRAKAGFATRVHTIPNFLEINRRVSVHNPAHLNHPHFFSSGTSYSPM